MSKKTSRSWKLMLLSTAVLIVAPVVLLNVGAEAHGSRYATVVAAAPSASASASTSTKPTPEDTCTPVPPPICENETPSAKPSTSTSPSSSPTPGGGSTEKSKISIEYSNKTETFKGRVDSASSCEKGRRVDLFKVAPGKDTSLGHTVTLKKGKYKIPFPDANGRYYTKVKTSKAGKTTCKGAQSKTISV